MMHLGIESLLNPLLLAKRKLHRSTMSSSYDRRGGNHDWSNYIRREGRAAVLMEADGPGCVTRIWTADPQKGTIRIFIDGNSSPAIECPFTKLFELLPLSQGIGGESAENYARSKEEAMPMGHTTYCPIPFQHHCKITIDPEDDNLYYHVNADLYPPGTQIESFVLASSLDSELVTESKSLFEGWKVGLPIVDMTHARDFAFELAPREDVVLLNHTGAGIVRGLRIAIQSDLSSHELSHVRENLWVVAHFDDDERRDPSVRAPIGPMFLDYGQDPRPRALFCGCNEVGEYYCFFPMPHHEKASIRLVNKSVLPLNLTASILHEPANQIDRDLLRFRATWHTETPFGPDHRDYGGVACRLLNLDGFNNVEFLYAFGAGHFVGCGFNIDLTDGPTDRAACEGDEMFFIDDDPRLTMYGTGAEDYLNDAWGIRGYAGPLSGDALSGEWGTDVQLYGYRLHITDPVPFLRKGRFTIEHGTGNNCSGHFKSVAFWYMDPSLTRTRIEEARWEAIRNGTRKMNEEEE